ncbi:MAG: UDP-N-acetylmuramoyl-L-alanyl-D-glutamate--2,6-diaminopimelate ligase [Spirochaetaceae bacterium]|jgi:UDP-N-acetylmuramoyl-L-alanyl-D-glutamate--2,6-diaminopimelate ligase|nr:UDP-N-acetylmuramoyl-L-alanyl-D-glutamate--2,6-diaminopimelate ligase [Spirochaetaceae bacterium]
MTATELFTGNLPERMNAVEWKGDGGVPVTGLEYDSRAVKAGSIYFALPGIHADGHDFIVDAVKNGAAVIVHQHDIPVYDKNVFYVRVKDSRFAMSAVADAFYHSPSKRLTVIGVTGTEGKSTTVYLIFQLLRLAGKKAGFISTVQYSEDGAERWNTEHQTTPEAPLVHKRLARMLGNGCEYAVLEASSHGLSPRTNRLGDVLFDAGIMTNVTHEHLEFHGTWEQYRDDKAALFRAIGRSVDAKGGGIHGDESFGVVNADDPGAAYFAACTGHKTYSHSVKGGALPGGILPGGADLTVIRLEAGPGGNVYDVRVRDGGGAALHIEDRLPGAFNAGNVLASLLCVSRLLKKSVAELCPLVPELRPVRGRMTAVRKGQPFEVLVDYAHTPSSFETVLPPLRERADRQGGRIIALFGSAGERDTQKRALQGRIAARYSDMIFLCDEDPRGEEPAAILEEIAAGVFSLPAGECFHRDGFKRDVNLFLIPDRPAAIRAAFSAARPGDLVLLLGKGHENSIIYSSHTMKYDEIAEAERALDEAGLYG